MRKRATYMGKKSNQQLRLVHRAVPRIRLGIILARTGDRGVGRGRE